MKRALAAGAFMAAGLVCWSASCGPGADEARPSRSGKESDIWIVERDMPQTRNLVPVLNRTTLVAAGAGAEVEASVGWQVEKRQVEPGPFWPNYGRKALMSTPVRIPEGFPCREPDVLAEPQVVGAGSGEGGSGVLLKWAGIKLSAGRGAAVHGDVLLGPPDMFHTEDGLRFGDIVVRTEYRVERGGAGSGAGDAVRAVCRLTVINSGAVPAEELDFSFFFPRALLDAATGGEVPLVDRFAYEASGFDDPRPLDLLITDGLGRGAWGPRCTVRRGRLAPGESVSCSFEATGKVAGGTGDAGQAGRAGVAAETLIVPLISIVARVAARYWPSSVVEVRPPGRTHYSDYTHFNLVVADSKLFRIGGTEASVLPSSPFVRSGKNVPWPY